MCVICDILKLKKRRTNCRFPLGKPLEEIHVLKRGVNVMRYMNIGPLSLSYLFPKYVAASGKKYGHM